MSTNDEKMDCLNNLSNKKYAQRQDIFRKVDATFDSILNFTNSRFA